MSSIELAGRMIKNARLMNGETLAYSSEAIGISKTYLHEIESGLKIPAVPMIDKLCEYFDLNLIDMNYLYDRIPNKVRRQIQDHLELQELLISIDDMKLSDSDEKELYDKIVHYSKRLVRERAGV